MLEFIPHNLEGNLCEMMSSICLCMMIDVTTQNTRMHLLELILMLTQGTQTSNVEEEDERDVLVPIEEGGVNPS